MMGVFGPRESEWRVESEWHVAMLWMTWAAQSRLQAMYERTSFERVELQSYFVQYDSAE